MAFTFDSKYEENSAVHQNSTIEFFPDLAQFLEDDSEQSNDGIQSKWALIKIGTLQSKIDSLYANHSSRFSYKISMFTIISLANEVFGYDGWSSQILDSNIESAKESSNENEGTESRYTATGTVSVRVSLADGTYTEATGFSTAYNLPKGMCYGNCKKQAVTDASKNAILGFRDMLLDYEVKIKIEQER